MGEDNVAYMSFSARWPCPHERRLRRPPCSNSTVAGDYTFEIHGTALSSDGSSIIGYVGGVGVVTFDGNGNLFQEDYVLRNGTLTPGGPPNPSGFHTEETGTYLINEDCTGSANITLAPGGNTRSEVLVVTQTGEIHGQVTAAEVNGSPAVLQASSSFQRITRH
jgi:hypothetical protein